MRIGIDTRALETGHRYRGIGTYARNLIKSIAKIDRVNDYFFLTQQSPSEASKIAGDGFKFRDILIRQTADPSRYNYLKDQYVLPRAIRKNKIDVVHFLDQLSCPIVKGAKTIVTVNDLFQLKEGKKTWKNALKAKPIRRADRIIAISQYVKNDLVEFLKVDPQKIEVIYDGYDATIYRPSAVKNSSKKYFFYIGSFVDHEPRKNLDFLLKIFANFRQKNSEDIDLVIVGKTGSESKRLKKIAAEYGIAEKVIFKGYVPKETDLLSYFQNALALIFPSLLEGFGLPPLQAMACGTPVISSNASSLPEVVGDGGVLLDPTDVDSWVEVMMKISQSEEYRAELIEAGLSQAKKFSWEKCAKETLEVYEEVIRNK